MPYSPEQESEWIVTMLLRDLWGEDLDVLKRMIAVDLHYAYQQGRKDALAITGAEDKER